MHSRSRAHKMLPTKLITLLQLLHTVLCTYLITTMSCSTLTSGPPPSCTDTPRTSSSVVNLGQAHNVALLPLQLYYAVFLLSTLTSAGAACNTATALHLILQLALSFFSFTICLSHTLSDSIFPLPQCRSVSLSSSLLADADCLCNAMKMSWVAIQSRLLPVVLL